MGLASTFKVIKLMKKDNVFELLECALCQSDPLIQEYAIRFALDSGNNKYAKLIIKYLDKFTEKNVQIVQGYSSVLTKILKEKLKNIDENIRINAIRIIKLLKNPQNAKLLMPYFSDIVSDVRNNAVEALLKLADEGYAFLEIYRNNNKESDKYVLENKLNSLTESLFAALQEDIVKEYRPQIIEKLIKFNEYTYNLLFNLLTGSDKDIRNYITECLYKMDDKEIVRFLFKMAQQKQKFYLDLLYSVYVKRQNIKFGNLIVDLIKEIQEEKIHNYGSGRKELAWIPSIKLVINKQDVPTQIKLIKLIFAYDLPIEDKVKVIQELFPSLSAGAQISIIKFVFSANLPKIKEEMFELLIEVEEDVIMSALNLVEHTKNFNKVEVLSPFLSSPYPNVRKKVSQLLSKNSFEKYMTVFDSLDENTKKLAGKALAKIDIELANKISDELHSMDANRRMKALKIISITDKNKELSKDLLDLINDDNKAIRATVVKLISTIGSKEAIKGLIRMLGDKDRRTRANTIEALEKLGSKKVVVLLAPFLNDPDNRVRANAAKALWNLGYEESRNVITQMLKSNQKLMRLSGIWALKETNIPGTRLLLKEIVKNDPDEEVKMKAQNILEELE